MDIKLRAWDGERMWFFDFSKDFSDVSVDSNGFFGDCVCGNEGYVQMLCTGVVDMNGKLIYDGDILQRTFETELTGAPPKYKRYPPNAKRKIVYHDGAFYFSKNKRTRKGKLSSVCVRYNGFEIIGNIHENS